MALVAQGSITTIVNETTTTPTLARYRLAYYSSVGGWGIVGDAGTDDPDPGNYVVITLTKGTAVDAVKLLNYYYYSGVCVQTGAYTLDLDGVAQVGEIGTPLIGMDIGNGAAGSISVIDATETLEKKTINKPKINENVELDTIATKLNYLHNVTPGTQAATKAVVADGNVNTGILKCTELHIGETGAEIEMTITPAIINSSLAGFAAADKALSKRSSLANDTAPKTASGLIAVTEGYLPVSMVLDTDLQMPACHVDYIGTEFVIDLIVTNTKTLNIIPKGGSGNLFKFMKDNNTQLSWTNIRMTDVGDSVILKMLTGNTYLVLGGTGVDGS